MAKKKKKEQLTESEPSESTNSDSDSNSETLEEEKEEENREIITTEYEKQRQLRIAENKSRLEFLGLRQMSNSLMGSSQISRKGKGKSKGVVVKKKEKEQDDDDYKPNDDDDDDGNGDLDSSSDEFEEERKSRSKVKNRKSVSIKQKKPVEFSDFMDEDEALMQAIALSLKDSGGNSDLQHHKSSQSSNAQSPSINEKGNGHSQEDNSKRRKRKLFHSRVQMTEDDVVMHFCQFDEVGRGSITLRDLQRMAATHDFTWTDKELADMIRCFDSDSDGKLTLDDFRNIAQHCNMLQSPENP